ncbi:esterase-like activity of phytase family protein [Sphingomonas sp.]|uniref:esterase-like activity of phytase family protein n=1 Tax=Sphingomonas sp. TaxID=28214 RepID=UPI003342A636
MRILLSLLLVLLLVPEGSRPVHRDVLGSVADVRATPVALDRADPRRTRVGDLVWLGGVTLSSHDPAFGGFSSLAVAGDRFTLLSDGGNIVRFALGRDGRLRAASFGDLPGGPGTGWSKRSRDSESMSVDPHTGAIWVGFENANALWRYAAGFARAEARVRPAVIRHWPENAGAEAMTLLPGGGMVAIGERAPWRGATGRGGVVFYGDPVLHPRRGFRFNYLPPAGYDPSDMTVLPDGRWLILNRRFSWARFSSVLSVVDPAQVRPGATVRGRDIATLAAPLIHENFEGVAATREGRATTLWLVSDDNQLPVQRTLLLKFRLDPIPPKQDRKQ